FSDFLAEVGDIPPQFAEPLQVIRQEAERAATIVKNLLSFARSQEGERKLQPIGPIIESTLALLRNQLMANKVEATLEVDHGLPDVEVNGNQIKQVFVNLINNANQAIASDAPSGRIWVTAKRLGILGVDDEPHILYYMRATLESWGHAVEVASDGAYALERAIAGDFDVIICDLRMPHLSGREMYQKLARHDPRAAERIIFA